MYNGHLAEDQIDVDLASCKSFFGLYTADRCRSSLLLAAVLLIWNTIRTAMFARRREIEVMKLVGATNWFIRIPFMLEGLLQGISAASPRAAALWLSTAGGRAASRTFPPNSGFAALVVADGYDWTVMLMMLAIGMLAGAIGSGIAASRFLDV